MQQISDQTAKRSTAPNEVTVPDDFLDPIMSEIMVPQLKWKGFRKKTG